MIGNIKVYLREKLASFLNPTYTEKDAIHDHSVGRYKYAVQLIKAGGDMHLMKAFAWLSLAADEIDMKKEASRLQRQVEYELKKRGLFEKTLELEHAYRQHYSAEALRKQIENSYNPLHILLRWGIGYIEQIVKLADYIEKNLLKERGSYFDWGGVMLFLSMMPLLSLFTFKLPFFTIILILLLFIVLSVISVIWEKRKK
jgi:hypothetical protein